jgi:Uma2 family endonuclease
MSAQPVVADNLLADDAARGSSFACGRLQEVAMSAQPRFRIPMPADGKWTQADLDALRDDVHYRTEIVDGILIVSPAPHPWHVIVARRIANAIEVEAPPDVLAYTDVEIRWVQHDERLRSLAPDVLVAPGNLVEQSRPYVRREDVRLVVEVESPSSKSYDRKVKPGLYAALGIPAMWRIERGITLVEYRLTTDGGTEVVQTVEGGKFHTDVPFPVTVDLDALR